MHKSLCVLKRTEAGLVFAERVYATGDLRHASMQITVVQETGIGPGDVVVQILGTPLAERALWRVIEPSSNGTIPQLVQASESWPDYKKLEQEVEEALADEK